MRTDVCRPSVRRPFGLARHRSVYVSVSDVHPFGPTDARSPRIGPVAFVRPVGPTVKHTTDEVPSVVGFRRVVAFVPSVGYSFVACVRASVRSGKIRPLGTVGTYVRTYIL